MNELRTACLACAIVMLLGGCGSKSTETTESARFFYFDAMLIGGGGKVFVYESVNDPLYPEEIWHRRFSGDHHTSHIYSAKLTPELDIEIKSIESISRTGAALTKMELYYRDPQAITLEEDSAQTVRVRISEPTTFLFGPPDTAMAAKYQVEYIEPGPDSIRVILTRLRRFVGHDTYVFNGEELPAMKYRVSETLETETEGFTTSTWQTDEIYAKGLGLVYYRKAVNPDFILEYRLKEITTLEILDPED